MNIKGDSIVICGHRTATARVAAAALLTPVHDDLLRSEILVTRFIHAVQVQYIETHVVVPDMINLFISNLILLIACRLGDG
jgi:hypothetical protein